MGMGRVVRITANEMIATPRVPRGVADCKQLVLRRAGNLGAGPSRCAQQRRSNAAGAGFTRASIANKLPLAEEVSLPDQLHRARNVTRHSVHKRERKRNSWPKPRHPPSATVFNRSFLHWSQYTHDVVYGDLWERPGLSKRDRSLITLAAIIATYRPEQLTSHLGRAINNGVTKEEISEVITHLAFYAGWPAAMSAAQLAYTAADRERRVEVSVTMADRHDTPIGFIGLGTMGSRMAANLQKAGYRLVVNDLRQASAASFLQGGAEWADTPQALAERCRLFFTSLPEPAGCGNGRAWPERPARRHQAGRRLFRSVDQLANPGEEDRGRLR